MDPLSIAAGSASLVVLCVKVSATLYTWVDDTRQVDSSVTGVCDEILALSRVLDAISKSWKRNPQIASAQIDPDGTLWSSVRGSLDDCRATLERLDATLEDVQRGAFLGRGFLRRPTKQIKLSLKMKDIVVYKQRVQSYNSAMQSALHMINLCLLLQSNSSQETVFRTLSDLKSQIGRVEGALQSRDNVTALGDEHDESQRISQNLKKLAHAAETFHSSASAIMTEGSRSTVWGGSMLGDPLSQEELSNIENWIPPPGITEEDEQGEDGLSSTGMSSSAADSSVKREPITGTDLTLANDSDSDSDIEKDLTRKFEELALVKLEERDYEKAEQFFRKVIDRRGMEDQSPENLVAINIKLAYTCCFQGKWEEAENIIIPIATGKQKVDVSVFHGLHTLALLYFERSELDTADKYCKRALVGKKKILGKEHSSYYESINLRARICLAKGDRAESEVYLSFLPPGHTDEPPASPLDYLSQVISSQKIATPKNTSPLVTPPLKTPLALPSPYTVSNGEASSMSSVSPAAARPHIGVRMAQDFGSPRHGGSQTPKPPRSATTFYQEVTNQQPHTPSVHPGPPAVQQPFYPQPAPASTSNALLPTQSYTGTAVPSSRRTQTMLIVGIDFGTQDSAVAFAFISNTEAKEDIITEWPGAGNYSTPRVPSVLYYDQYQKVVGWGTDIADAITPMGYPRPNIQKVEWFKLQLMDKGNNYVDFVSIPPLPPGKSAVDVTADFLFKLRQTIRTQLRKWFGAIFDREERNIHFSFTVPTMFNEATQLKLRNAIVAAGFVSTPYSEHLSLISEPKSLAMYCTKTGLLNLKAGDAFIVVDCGGGTVDLIAYEVEDELLLTMKELTVTTGDSCGSTATNRNFNNILQSKLRLMRLPQGSKTASRVYGKCLVDFENRIRHDFRNNGQKWAVDVGIEADYPEAGIEEGYMVFTNDEVLACFEPVVDRIIELIRNQIIDVRGKHKILQNILVAGTFGANEHLFQQIKLHMPPELMPRIVRPMDSANAMSKGAVTNVIVDRARSHEIARRNYFVDKLQLFQNGLHPDYYFTGSPDGKQYCKNTHQLLIKKGERVKKGEPLKIVMEKFLAPSGPLVIEDTIYTCDDDEYPAFTTDPRLKPWRTCLIDLSKRRADLESLKVQTANGVFYHIQYALYTILNDTLVFEAVFMGEVIGTWFLAS